MADEEWVDPETEDMEEDSTDYIEAIDSTAHDDSDELPSDEDEADEDTIIDAEADDTIPDEEDDAGDASGTAEDVEAIDEEEPDNDDELPTDPDEADESEDLDETLPDDDADEPTDINDNQATLPCICSVHAGDTVMVAMRNGEPTVIGRAGWGDAIETSIESAAAIAAQAQGVANATNQHFFSDSSGVHVTEAEGDATTDHNILINSLGILLRKATNYLVSITSSAIAFYDGLGTAASNIVAQFGTTGAQIGKASAGNYVMIDSDSFDLYHSSYEMVHFGYGEGNAVSGTAEAPYYTLGTRARGSAVGNYSVAEGCNTTASGYTSHAEGDSTTASETFSHAEGFRTVASGYYSHAEGYGTTASKTSSHAEGYDTTASGGNSHAEGGYTTASGHYSHAQNYRTIASSKNQTALGKYNVEDNADTYAVIVGNGTSDSARSNALTVDWDGDVETAGSSTIRTSNIDRDGTLPSTNQFSNGRFRIADVDGDAIAYSDGYQLTTGETGARLVALAEDANGDSITNTLRVGKKPDGTNLYYVTDPAAFRRAIGAPSDAVTTTTTVSQVITAGSGRTISSVTYAEWGKVAMLSVSISGWAASTGSQTGGTVVSGKRPVHNVYATDVNSSYATYAQLTTAGALTVYWGTAPSTSTTYIIRFIYILA